MKKICETSQSRETYQGRIFLKSQRLMLGLSFLLNRGVILDITQHITKKLFQTRT